jgi:hypothetical protein
MDSGGWTWSTLIQRGIGPIGKSRHLSGVLQWSQPTGPWAHPVDISDDEVEFVKEVEAPSREEPAPVKHEKPPSAEVPLEREGTLERPLERVDTTGGDEAIPSLPRADTQPAVEPGVQEGLQRVESVHAAQPPEPTPQGVSTPMVPPPAPPSAGEVVNGVQGGAPAGTSLPGPSVSQAPIPRMPIPLFTGLPGLPVLRSAEPEVKPESAAAGPFPQGSFVSGTVSGTTYVSGSTYSFSTQAESSGTRRSGRSERSGESRRSRDHKGKGKAKIQQLEAQLRAHASMLEAERERNRRMMAGFIMRSEGKTMEEALEELDRQEAEMLKYGQP